MAGYTGPTCETDIDDCAGDPCLNGGICNDAINSYTCDCMAGYTGSNCEIDIDDCAGDPCLNGGICSDAINSYICECVPGYTGDNCETDIDEAPSAVPGAAAEQRPRPALAHVRRQRHGHL